MKKTITEAEWMAELARETQAAPPGAFTAIDVAKRCGISRCTAECRAKTAVRKGILQTGMFKVGRMWFRFYWTKKRK